MLRVRRANPPVLTGGCLRLLLPLLPTFNDIASGLQARAAVRPPLMPPSRRGPELHVNGTTRAATRSDTRKSL